MQVQILEQTIFNFLILEKSRFPPKKFYNINYCASERHIGSCVIWPVRNRNVFKIMYQSFASKYDSIIDSQISFALTFAVLVIGVLVLIFFMKNHQVFLHQSFRESHQAKKYFLILSK